MPIHSDITEIIGHTPLVKLQRLPQQFGCVTEIVLKLEGKQWCVQPRAIA